MFNLDMQKLKISAFAAGLFFIISNPKTYQIVNSLLGGNMDISNFMGCPTLKGRLLHTLIFFIVNVAVMYLGNKMKGSPEPDNWGLYIKYSLYGSLFFFLLSSREMYDLVGGVVEGVAGSGTMLQQGALGCPNMLGTSIHSAVYCILLYAVMLLPKDN